jgi:hypothetical protein
VLSGGLKRNAASSDQWVGRHTKLLPGKMSIADEPPVYRRDISWNVWIGMAVATFSTNDSYGGVKQRDNS